MKSINVIGITILFIASTMAVELRAQQTGKDWLLKMNNAYATASSIQLEFEATYYSTHTMVNPMTSMKGKVLYTGSNYYSDAMGQEIVVNKKSTLIIDKAEKTITVLPGSTDKKKGKDVTPAAQPDSAWLAATDITLMNTTGATRTIVIKEKNSMYEKTEIVINAITYAMEQVTYYYNAVESGAKPSFVVKYRNVRFNESISDSQFSEKKYIQRKGGTISPAPAWKDYSIIDLTDQYK